MAKDINKKDKKLRDGERVKKKVNPFDVIIVLLLLCLLGTLAYRVYDGVSVENADQESRYVVRFECDEAYNSLMGYLGADTAVYFNDGELLGYIYDGKDGIDRVQVIERLTEAESESAEIELPDEQESASADTDVAPADKEGESASESEIIYEMVKLSGSVRLNHSTIKVENGGYYVVGDNSFAVGSLIKVHTEKAVFTLRVVSIEALE